MTEFVLKCIAMATMLVDHIGFVFFPKVRWLRLIGRACFPLYAFMIAEGVIHTERTRRTKEYFMRLGLLALLSEVPYDRGLYGSFPNYDHTNVIITLLLGMIMLVLIRRFRHPLVQIVSVAACAWAADLIGSSYGYAGVLLILLYDLYLEHFAEAPWYVRCAVLTGIGVLFGGYHVAYNAHFKSLHAVVHVFRTHSWTQLGLLLYNRKKGYDHPVFRWTYRLFYPLHTSVIALLRIL